ncbi:bifunctional [glutamate--ammonia ligase]-adenylyl-L-tyrosine phosphorylase/[glutamate--ammonia-ligase] adenylyltransferase [Gallaecimonas sp. GXIMD1310]|uniref:bifunctional [glutamate--ammonia ligase]-adenylyl-L-tyrosine phosphorylase/[glutamate--ammonia-ligase] adenylyltransferase n=1 Tax=Gallaecimonas sp. GXIMD1310 TaxID=3131926 RepID=UPI003243D4DC
MSAETLLAAQADQALAGLPAVSMDDLTPAQRQLLRQALACSDFFAQQLRRDASLLPWLLSLSPRQYLQQAVQPALHDIDNEKALYRTLRQYRHRHLAALVWLSLQTDFSEEDRLHGLSRLAEGLIVAARDWLYAQQCSLRGVPTDEQGNSVPLLVLGMGKLGGGELNFSSDIDLIFLYPRSGETRGGRRVMDNHEFFTRLGQKLIQALDNVDADGFVYRVDMRLRPFGEAGPLALSFAALEDYYQSQGREWERYAMVKGRLMGGGQGFEGELDALLRPFVYRRYLDYSTIDSLRDMKQLIEAEVRRRNLTDNIKLGPGGIREVEFLVQVFQLIRGGREPALRTPSLLAALAMLPSLGVLSEQEASRLRRSYLFLRRLENNLQAIADKQTQTLPSAELDQARLAALQGFDSYPALRDELQSHQQFIHHLFQDLIAEESHRDNVAKPLRGLMASDWSEAELSVMFTDIGLAEPHAVASTFAGLRQQLARKSIGDRGQRQLARLLPLLCQGLVDDGTPAQTLARLGKLLTQVVSRTVYLDLLLENPGARQQLLKLVGQSRFIGEQLTAMPLLLDELIDPRHLYAPTAPALYASELQRFMLRIEPDDLEGQMDALRHFKAAQVLRIAAADVTGALAVTVVSDHLSYLAEALLAACLPLAWRDLARRHGQPPGCDASQHGLLIVAYGKLGGLELGYSSDLDLVVMTDLGADEADASTDGPRPISVREFYLKLVQRLTHWLATRTLAGVLYDIDMRLRPSGASGLLVTTLTAFAQYQQQDAWLWEHQALVRARPVLGCPALQQRFQTIRQDVLCQPRDGLQLKTEVAAMREKMRRHLNRSTPTTFDLKQGEGGITDIEFLVQYWLLAAAEPALIHHSDNLRQLDALATAGYITATMAEQLKTAYTRLRQRLHHQSLDDGNTLAPAADFAAERALVSGIWAKTFQS